MQEIYSSALRGAVLLVSKAGTVRDFFASEGVRKSSLAVLEAAPRLTDIGVSKAENETEGNRIGWNGLSGRMRRFSEAGRGQIKDAQDQLSSYLHMIQQINDSTTQTMNAIRT